MTPGPAGVMIEYVRMLSLFVATLLSLPQARALSNDAKAELLETGRVVEARTVGKGVTETWRVTLEGMSGTHDASFQYVDERAAVKDVGNGVREINFVDSYRYNIAGYRLAALIGLGHMVPVSVEREWRGRTGAMTWWVDDVLMDEAGLNEEGLKAPDQADWSRQTYRVRVFTELIYDTDRNQGNNLITNAWKIWMIDFSRAFRRWPKLRNQDRLMRCDRALFARLRALRREELEGALAEILTSRELEGLWARRGLIVEHFEALIAERGADQVLY